MKRLFLLSVLILMCHAMQGQNAGYTISGVVREYDLNLSKKGLDGVQVQVTVGGVLRTDVTHDGGEFNITHLVNCKPGDPVATDKSSFLKTGYELFYPEALKLWRVSNSTTNEPTEILMCKSSRINEVRQKLFHVVDKHHKALYEKKLAELQQLNLEKELLDRQIVILESQLRDTAQMMKIVNEWLYLDRLKCDSVLAKAYTFFENGAIDKACEIMNQQQMKSSDYYAKRRKEAVSEEAQARMFVKKRLMMNFDSHDAYTAPLIERDCDFLIASYSSQLQEEDPEDLIDKNLIDKYLAEAYSLKGDISTLVTEDFKLNEIINNYHIAASMGNAHAQCQLAKIFENQLEFYGINTSNTYQYYFNTANNFNLDSARYLYQKSAAQADSVAIKRLRTFPDFSIKDKNRNDIFFHILPDGKSVSVVPVSLNKSTYTGNIVLPKKVKHAGKYYVVKEIASKVFEGSEIRTIDMPSTVVRIGERAFANCYQLQEIAMPNSVTEIGIEAFRACFDLKSLKISNKLTEIKDRTFFGCINLTKVVIPESVVRIGAQAFDNCNASLHVKLPKSKIELSFLAIGPETVSTDTASSFVIHAMSFSGEELKPKCDSCDSQRIQFTDSITQLAPSSYANCCRLQAVILSDTIEEIPYGTFSNCECLRTIKLPDSLKAIGEWAFSSCKRLRHIDIPNSVTTIAYHAFLGCDNLETINISNSVSTINSGAFLGCNNLKEVVLPNSLKKVEAHTFAECYNLTHLSISNSIEEIEENAFGTCQRLTEIVIPQSVKTMGENVFEGGCRFLTIHLEQSNPNNCKIKKNNWDIGNMLIVPQGSVKEYRSAPGWCTIPIITDNQETVKRRQQALVFYSEIQDLQLNDSDTAKMIIGEKWKKAAAIDSCFALDCANYLSTCDRQAEAEVYYTQALSFYEKLIKDCPKITSNITNSLNDEAYYYMYRKTFDAALHTIDIAIELNPDKASLYDSKGEILLSKGDIEGARLMWQKVIEKDPDFVKKHKDSELYKGLFDN